ncbi:MAG: aromatic ring-hydroxylating dioxygenase subunit alpha [Burkholderiaceae bacterium]
MTTSNRPRPAPPRRTPIPAEGEDGLFRQSWYPLCLSSELAAGQALGCDFLDGRVVAFRGEDGVARIASAYCPHLGADLSVGRVVGDRLQCAFHQWEYDAAGTCVKTGIGDPPPAASLFVFPSQERWGIVWVFNGETPLFDLPDLDYPDDQLEIWSYKYPRPFHSDPWVFAANTPDMQHLKAVHRVKFEHDDPHDAVIWDPWGLKFNVKAKHQGGVPIDWDVGLRGTGFFWRSGSYGDFWCAAVTGFGLPRPGMHQVYGAAMVVKGEHGKERLERMRAITERTIGEDADILDTIRYRQGLLTAADRTLARYLSMVRDFPRAHPSAPYIR